MKLRTEVHIPESARRLQPTSRIFSIGSCFAENMYTMLQEGQLQSLCNPFGTLFSPIAILTALRRIVAKKLYQDSDLVEYGGSYISLDHHPRFDEITPSRALEKMNKSLMAAHDFLKGAECVIITLGSAYTYKFLPKDLWVSNCHKIPAKFFEKILITENDICEVMLQISQLLTDFCGPQVQILTTISPVRHTRDGFSGNQRSKGRLINGLLDAAAEDHRLQYLPVYEIMMDDLRDYRFYTEDLIHPSSLALEYIYEQFEKAYFSENLKDFLAENRQILRALNHRPSQPDSPENRHFQVKISERIQAQQKKVSHLIFTGQNALKNVH